MQLVISLVSPITLQLQEMNWYPPAGLVLSSGHTVNRRRDGFVQSETWPSIHFQSGRWQGMSHESSPSSNSSGALYPENRRITTNHYNDDSQRAVPRREHQQISYSDTPTFDRSSRTSVALQHVHWYSGDTTDVRNPLKDAVRSSFSSSSALPFSQGYHTIDQRTPLPGLQLRTTSWPRQLSTRLRSLLCLTMGLKSWRIYECDGYRDS